MGGRVVGDVHRIDIRPIGLKSCGHGVDVAPVK
jgi:hypothetical protein